MKISIEKNLNELKTHLEEKGYTIVSENDVADAYIYDKTPIMQITAKNFSPISELATDPILLINASGKTFSEIEQILTQKTYNKIF